MLERGAIDVVNEWPDVATAVRALAAGPSQPAIEAVGYEVLWDALTEMIASLHDVPLGSRISSKLGWVTAEKS